jgi:hypothetical protein
MSYYLAIPDQFEFKIVECEIAENEEDKFRYAIRAKLTTEEEWNRWFSEFKSMTNTSWIVKPGVRSRRESSKFLCSQDYVCHHSSLRKVTRKQKTQFSNNVICVICLDGQQCKIV